MRFGYSIGDFIAVLKLANDVRKRFVNAPGHFKALSEDVKGLSNVLRDVEDFELETGLPGQKKQRLNEILRDCHEALNELQGILNKYQEIQPKSKGLEGISRGVWKRLQWDQDEIDGAQERIHRSIGAFDFFLSGLTSHLAIATTEKVHQISQRQDYQIRQEILNWLIPVNYAPQKSDYLRRKQPGTGNWLFDTKQFRLWLDSSRETLYCPGIPGAGKTILTSIVINHLEEEFRDDSTVVIAYVYCNFRQRQEQRLESLLASLLKQIVQGYSSIPSSVEKLYNRHQNKGTQPTSEELSRALSDFTASFSRVFILVDALDECQIPESSLIGFLSEIFALQSRLNISLFATSRYSPKPAAAFEDSLKQDIRANGEDVHRYLQGHLHELPSFVSRNHDLQRDIIDRITEAVDGMFLLAHLHLGSLIGKRSPRAVKAALQQLQSGSEAIDIAYQEAMQRIQGLVPDQRELALQVL